MPIRPEKENELKSRMKKLSIFEKDLEEKFILGSGKGGQKIQKTHSCVYLKHLPTGIEVKCQKERSREMNRFFARRELCDRIDETISNTKSKKALLSEKIKKQKKRRKRRKKNDQ